MVNKQDISLVTGTVRKSGNGAHIVLPKAWIGRDVHVIPVDIFREEALNEMIKGHRFGSFRRRRKR